MLSETSTLLCVLVIVTRTNTSDNMCSCTNYVYIHVFYKLMYAVHSPADAILWNVNTDLLEYTRAHIQEYRFTYIVGAAVRK